MKRTAPLMKKSKSDFKRENKQRSDAQAELLKPPSSPKPKIAIKISSFSSLIGNTKNQTPKKSFEANSNNNDEREITSIVESPKLQPTSKKRKFRVDDINLEKISIDEYGAKDSEKSSMLEFPALDSPGTSDDEDKFNANNNSNARKRHNCTKQRKKEIGNWGEELAYKILKKRNPHAQTIWHNETNEEGLPYDISQTQGENNHEKYYEVKTTVAPPSSPAHKPSPENSASFSSRQVAKMKEQRGNYNIIRVYNAEKENPKLATINDPYQKIFHPDRDDKVNSFKPLIPVKSFKLKI